MAKEVVAMKTTENDLGCQDNRHIRSTPGTNASTVIVSLTRNDFAALAKL